jgi:hypothetical protein
MRKHVVVLGCLVLGVACSSLNAADNSYGIPLAQGETLLSVNGVAVNQSGCANGMCPLNQGQFNNQGPIGTVVSNAVETVADGLLQWKANRMANQMSCSHVGGGYVGGASAEGVGSSTSSAADAISNACYYGRRQIVASATAQGSNGVWYAVVQYR